MDRYICDRCVYTCDKYEDSQAHLVATGHQMMCAADNVIPLPKKEASHHEKVSSLLGSSNYLTMHFDDSGQLVYAFGDGMNNMELAYAARVLSMICHDTMQATTRVGPK